MAADLELALGTHKKAKSALMLHMRAATEKQAREQKRDE